MRPIFPRHAGGLTAALLLALTQVVQALAAGLDHWPAEARAELEAMFQANAHKGCYATETPPRAWGRF